MITLKTHQSGQEKLLFTTQNPKEMAAYIFYCAHYKNPEEGTPLLLTLSDGEKLRENGNEINAWTEEYMPKETQDYNKKIKNRANPVIRKLIHLGVVKDQIKSYLDNAQHNKEFFERKMLGRDSSKLMKI